MPPRSAPPGRLPWLDRDTIVTEALGLAREEGLAAVSMRRLAEGLGVSPMSLYRHVADREDLLLQMLDVVADAVGTPPVGEPPRATLTAIMHALHRAFRRDPWVVQVLATEGLASPRILPAVDAAFGALLAAGLSTVQTRAAFALLLEFAYGEVLVALHDDGDSYGRRMMRDVDPQRFPHLAAVVADQGFDHRDHFADNLESVLDGLLGRP